MHLISIAQTRYNYKKNLLFPPLRNHSPAAQTLVRVSNLYVSFTPPIVHTTRPLPVAINHSLVSGGLDYHQLRGVDRAHLEVTGDGDAEVESGVGGKQE